jgi:hypothetical protein
LPKPVVRDVVVDDRDRKQVTVEQRREPADALAVAGVEHDQRVGLVERRSASAARSLERLLTREER